MSASILDGAQFSTLSAFTIDFTKTRQMRDCTFIANDGSISRLSKPPVVITGLQPTPIVMLDEHIYSGHQRVCHNIEEKHVKIN